MTDRQTAEQYLKAAVRIVNPMPHGGCTLDLALKTCRHSLSCLSVNERGDCCESLVVDVENEGQFIELKKSMMMLILLGNIFKRTVGKVVIKMSISAAWQEVPLACWRFANLSSAGDSKCSVEESG